MNEYDNLEMLDMREREILEELGRLPFGDPKRKPLEDELSNIASIKVSYAQTELTRLNNNAKNDIEEAKLVIEQEKVKNEKHRNGIMLIQLLVGFIGGAFMMDKSYHMDEKHYPYKNMWNAGQKWIDRIARR